MTPAQIERVQRSFEKVAPHSEAAARMFYARLFEIAPQVRPLFRADLSEQGRKLMSTLAIVVGGLNGLDAILPAAKALAARHVGYGVEAEHYQPVGRALLLTLEEALGDAFDAETKEAWSSAYTLLSQVMIAEAYGQ